MGIVNKILEQKCSFLNQTVKEPENIYLGRSEQRQFIDWIINNWGYKKEVVEIKLFGSRICGMNVFLVDSFNHLSCGI